MVTWAPYGRRQSVAVPLGPAWPPLGRGRSFGPRMEAVGAWQVPWAPYRGRGDVAYPLGPIWTPWERGRSPGPRSGVVGRGRSPPSVWCEEVIHTGLLPSVWCEGLPPPPIQCLNACSMPCFASASNQTLGSGQELCCSCSPSARLLSAWQ